MVGLRVRVSDSVSGLELGLGLGLGLGKGRPWAARAGGRPWARVGKAGLGRDLAGLCKAGLGGRRQVEQAQVNHIHHPKLTQFKLSKSTRKHRLDRARAEPWATHCRRRVGNSDSGRPVCVR